MAPSDNVVYLGAGRSPRAALETLDALRGLASRELEGLLGRLFEEVDDAFFDRAERAGSDSEQQRYFVAMRQVRLGRPQIQTRFQEALDERFAALTRAQAGAGPDPQDNVIELELMDDTRVEEGVARDNASSRARARASLPLAQLCQRLDHLVAERTVDEESNPLDPRQLAEAFGEGVSALDIDIQPKLILYKLFEKQLLQHLPRLCEQANRQLAEAGVLPDLRTGGQVSRPASGSRRGGTGVTAPATGDAAGHGAGSWAGDATGTALPDEDRELLGVLRELLAEGKPREPGAQGGAQPQAAVAEVSQALGQVQGQLGGAPRALDAGEIRAALGQVLSAGQGINRAADDTIDIVSLLFDVILDDHRLSPSVKALIARLQIPVLRVALQDRSLFASRQHPARQLINELAHAAAGWTEPEDPERDGFYTRMAAVVEQVVDHREQGPEVFAEALAGFRDYLEQERERARLIEERTRQAAEGQAKVEDARERVQAAIDQRLSADAPDVVRRLLQEAWYKVLFITAVKEGTEGELWAERVAVMDRLVWSVEPKTDPAARKRMLTEMPGLLHDLREGLNAVMFNPHEMARLFRELEAEHLDRLASPPAPATPTPAPERVAEPAAGYGDRTEPPAVTSDKADGAGEPMDPDLAAALERLRGVDLGTWFELRDGEGRELRAKLSARLNRGRRFIFVNRAGFKLADREAEPLAEDYVGGRVIILDDDTLFDRALESVVTSLREMRAGQER
ncbi:DUF1631 domain-containing protein [Sediminicurvatus halobius]|uniref:DUF1631 domain-containing protein n=1 Tax=Sediminicurvatus halobius TaxID=2182432 RepID=A0A2U2N7I4_9GAMM|nr:DUF1631 domain-containing protein [Spiribacter halobius]PWG65126.1 hypothetical protein DEM34_02270 [Spiribacter halobius]UEX78925.1 DUF1631 domain-containing protein [Spiribacter halobius]